MYENFSGCRVLSYCVISNHFHLLLEVPPMADGGLSDGELLQRLGGLYSEAEVAGVAAELAEARKVSIGEDDAAGVARVAAIHARFTYRMHDLSEFMKGLLIRFTRWFNRMHSRSGTLWEERFKSVIVESGVASRTMAAYIDLKGVCERCVCTGAGAIQCQAQRWSTVDAGQRQRREGTAMECQGFARGRLKITNTERAQCRAEIVWKMAVIIR